MPLTYAFRLAPGPQALDQAMLAEKLGYERVWSPEVPAFGHDIWVHLARIAERTQRIGIGPAVLIPSYRHPVAQASAIATLEHIAPGRLMVAFGTGFTGRIALGQKPLSWEAMRHHLLQVRALLRGEAVDNDGGMAQLLASSGLLPDRPIRTPLLLAAQGPKGRAVAKEIADGLVALRDPDRATARGLHATARVADRRTRRHHSELRDSFRDARQWRWARLCCYVASNRHGRAGQSAARGAHENIAPRSVGGDRIGAGAWGYAHAHFPLSGFMECDLLRKRSVSSALASKR
jgi:alkanesulfonate monooxygenase SsuD/methylene tetrahydromethanopterin reductase-like flavin-dependent oxidoreductase (luciferase family)